MKVIVARRWKTEIVFLTADNVDVEELKGLLDRKWKLRQHQSDELELEVSAKRIAKTLNMEG